MGELRRFELMTAVVLLAFLGIVGTAMLAVGHPRAALQNFACERTKSRSNFKNEIFRTDLSLPHNPAGQILVVQKILPERLL